MESSHGFWLAPSMVAEQKLWVAVLDEALKDALSGETPSKKETARRWFREGGHHFQLVCDLANFDANFVRRKILSIIDKGNSL